MKSQTSRPSNQIMVFQDQGKYLNIFHSQAIIILITNSMQNQIIAGIQKTVFGDYSVPKHLPFRIVQAPFRRFSKYERDGHWNQKERLKYTVFLGFFRDLFEDPEKKKLTRVYEMISDMIITRNPNQCRSHHQKMEKYRDNIDQIITSVTEKYEPRVYKQIQQKYITLIKTLLQNSDKYVRIPISTDNRKTKLKRELSFLEESRLTEPKPRNHTRVVVEPESEELKCKEEKEDYRRTAVDYDEEDVVAEKPQKQPDFECFPLKEECQENEGAYQQVLPPQLLHPEAEKKLNSPQPHQRILQPNLAACSKLNQFEREMRRQQIKTWQFQRQWHLKNADHMMRQSNNQLESAKLCDLKIQFYKESLQK